MTSFTSNQFICVFFFFFYIQIIWLFIYFTNYSLTIMLYICIFFFHVWFLKIIHLFIHFGLQRIHFLPYDSFIFTSNSFMFTCEFYAQFIYLFHK